jgi:hypothetical protein
MEMKNFIHYLLISCFFMLIGLRSNAQSNTSSSTQDYTFSAGLKFGGYENGISAKYFMADNTALEGILGFRNSGVVITGLYEIHQEAFNVPALKFYYGFGAHIGAIGSGNYRRFNGDNEFYNNNKILLGLDGVLGLEYIIPQSPIAVSLDLNPRAELATGPFFDIAPGLGVKYFFK